MKNISERLPMKVIGSVLLFVMLVLPLRTFGADNQRSAVSKKDRCPVCGMFVYKYPKWVARIEFSDGSSYYYDGAKDMFKHYMDIPKYSPGKQSREIVSISVTDYYSVSLIDGKSAFYVVGSNILGPMGHELIPLKDLKSAQEFAADHKGNKILRFDEITPEIIHELDKMQQGR